MQSNFGRTVLVVAFALTTRYAAGQANRARPARAAAEHRAAGKDDRGRSAVPARFWESAAAMCSVSIRTRSNLDPPLPGRSGMQRSKPIHITDPAQVSSELDRLKAAGCAGIDVGQVSEVSGRVYAVLATTDHYKLTSEVEGTLDDFRRFIRTAHSKGMAVTTFYNLGYCSIDAPFFLKAQDDVRAGRTNTREARWFIWSDTPNAPPPPGDTIFMVADPLRTWSYGAKGPLNTFSYGYDPAHPGPTDYWMGLKIIKPGIWEYSTRAGKYYWSKWGGRHPDGLDDLGRRIQMPHYNWYNREWQEEAAKIIHFWMDTGLDGISQDAPNWYPGCGWDVTRRWITGVIGSYGNVYMQAEGAGVLFEDPSAWITEGGYNSVRDYSLGGYTGVDNSGAILKAFETNDPWPIEAALRAYHDKVVDVRGVLWAMNARRPDDPPAKRQLQLAMHAVLGEILSGPDYREDPKLRWLLQTKAAHPALYNLSKRRKLPTAADDKHYAFLRTAADGSERILVVTNFQADAQTVDVDLSGVATAGLVDLESKTESPRQWSFKVELPAYGYKLYQVKPATQLQ